jgi:transcriptional regulator with XRE-family HTH domain
LMKSKPDRNAVAKELYAEWLKLPNSTARVAAGLPATKKEFAEKNGVDRSLLWHWERNPEFRRLIHNDVLDVINVDEVERIKWALKVKAFEGNIGAAKLLLEWAGLYGRGASKPSEPDVEDLGEELKDYTDEELRKILAIEDARESSDDLDCEEEDYE